MKDRDYNVVGASLLWALEKGLGDVFTDEVRNARGADYEVLATVIKEGAAEADKAAWFFNMLLHKGALGSRDALFFRI